MPETAVANGSEIKAIELALSGGGFRATLFHLGLIGFLKEAKLLEKVEIVCSVSGGSILAGHLITYWKDYIGTQEEFRKRAEQLVKWIQSHDLSGKALKNSMERVAQFQAFDSKVLEDEYRDLLSQKQDVPKTWQDLHKYPSFPSLHVIATHLNTGRPGVFSRNGFCVEEVEGDKEGNAAATLASSTPTRDQSIARAIAASSAFPPVFAPMSIAEDGNTSFGRQFLTDGGVFDNSGATWLTNLHKKEVRLNNPDRLVIVSDAGREFSTQLDNDYAAIFDLALRVTDTQANRITKGDNADAERYFLGEGSRFFCVRIFDPIDYFPGRPSDHTDEVQIALGQLRTELDQFSAEECLALYRHGYLAAQEAFHLEEAGLKRFGDLAERTRLRPTFLPTLHAPAWEPAASSLSGKELKEKLQSGASISKLNDAFSLVIDLAVAKYKLLVKKYRDKIRLIVALAVIAILLAAIAFYLLGTRFPREKTPPVPPTAVIEKAHGQLKLDEASIQNFGQHEFREKYRILRELANSTPAGSTVFAFHTQRLGSITKDHPYPAARVRFNMAGKLSTARLFLFLLQSNRESEPVISLLPSTEAGVLSLPAGNPDDRIFGLIEGRETLQPKDFTSSQFSLSVE